MVELRNIRERFGRQRSYQARIIIQGGSLIGITVENQSESNLLRAGSGHSCGGSVIVRVQGRAILLSTGLFKGGVRLATILVHLRSIQDFFDSDKIHLRISLSCLPKLAMRGICVTHQVRITRNTKKKRCVLTVSVI